MRTKHIMVTGLVLVGSFVDAGYLADPDMTDLVGLADMVASRDPAAREALRGAYSSMWVRGRTPEMLDGAIETAMSDAPAFTRGAIRSVAATRPGDAVAEIGTPTLVVSGSADPFLPACLTASQRLPNAALHVFNRVGHLLPVEVPNELAAEIDDFARHGAVNAASLAGG